RGGAKVAAKEIQFADDGDFEDQQASATPMTSDARNTPVANVGAATNGPFGATETALAHMEGDVERWHHIDEYLIQLQKYLMKDIPLDAGKNSKKGKKGRRRD